LLKGLSLIKNGKLMEKVVISNLLKNELSEFYRKFKIILKENNIKLIKIQNTLDIWCRDFMPVKRNDGKYVLFNYDPSYLKPDWQDKLTPRENIISICKELNVTFIDGKDIKLDGGNVVSGFGKAILTDAVFKENAVANNQSEQAAFIEKLSKYLDYEIIIIPHQPDDPLSHSDGVVRFLNKNTVLVNDFSSVSNPKLRESRSYLNRFFGSLGSHGLNIIQVPYDPVNEKAEDGMSVATGIYINYLETKKTVFLPRFGGNLKEKDAEALKSFKKLFKKVKKKVVLVKADAIAMKGGVLNCMTWSL
jgi:agmatine deiminase